MNFSFIVELILEMFVEPTSRFISPTLANDKKEVRKIYKSYIFSIIVFTTISTVMGYATFIAGEEPFYITAGITITIIFAIFAIIKIKRLFIFFIDVKKARKQ